MITMEVTEILTCEAWLTSNVSSHCYKKACFRLSG